MGLSRTSLQALLDEAAQRPMSGSVATLGRQHIYVTWDEFCQFARTASTAIPANIVPKLHREPRLAEKGYASDESILAALGFAESVIIDYSDYEAADEIFDLNLPDAPVHLQNRFDVILDFGTMEHVFHVPNFLSNLHRMLKPSGRIIHYSPASNCLDHGFYSFSPTFFADYYLANRYALHAVRVIRHQTPEVNSAVEVYDYLAAGRSGFDAGSLDHRVYYNLAIVQRTPESTAGVIPQQASYLREWQATTAPQAGQLTAAQEPAGTKADRLLKMTAGWPVLHRLARELIETWRGGINRYRKRHQFPLPKVRDYR